MNVRIEITVEEVREAVKEWLISHGRLPEFVRQKLDALVEFDAGVVVDGSHPNAKLEDPMCVIEYTVTRSKSP